MVRRRLSIGIQTFRTIREEGCYCVDKTPFIRRLLDGGRHYFLSRPRRFGKSLFLDTLKELFEGNESLFEGLAIRGDRDWSVRHPVVRLSFGSGHVTEPGGLRTEVADRLRTLEDAAAIVTRHESLLGYLVRDTSRQKANSGRLYDLLEANDFDGLEALFHLFYASIPYEWYTNNDIARYEGYYASVFYSYLAGLGLDITVEDSTSRGRLDMAAWFNGHVYLFELNVVEMAGEGAAMAQLQARGYAEKYRSRGEPMYLVGVEFSRETRNVVAFEVERA